MKIFMRRNANRSTVSWLPLFPASWLGSHAAAALLALAPVGCGSTPAAGVSDAGPVYEGGGWPGADTGPGADGAVDGGYGTSDSSRAPDSSGGHYACPLSEMLPPQCNPLAPSGPLVTSSCSSSEPPQAQGGTIADGTYVMQSAIWYGGCQPAATVQSTWQMCGGLWYNAESIAGSDAGTSETNYTSAVEGSKVILNPTCASQGGQAGLAHDFTASPGHLAVFTTYGPTVLVAEYVME